MRCADRVAAWSNRHVAAPWPNNKVNPDPTNWDDDDHYNPDRPRLNWNIEEWEQPPLPADGHSWPHKQLPNTLWRGVRIDPDHPDHADHPDIQGMRKILYGDDGTGGLFPGQPTQGNLHPDPNSPEGKALSNHILNFMEDTGQRKPQGVQFTQDHDQAPPTWLGRHWTNDFDRAEDFALNARHQGRGFGVMLQGDWDGRGEDLNRTNAGGSWQGENEITLAPGAPVNIKGVHIQHPTKDSLSPDWSGEQNWHNVLAQPQQRTAVASHPPLPKLWADYQDWHKPYDDPEIPYTAHDSVKSWGNVEEYLNDRHGLHPTDPATYDHPVTLGMAKLHSLAQSRPQVDGYAGTDDYLLNDNDLTTGAALGLLKIRRNNLTKKLEPDNPEDEDW
jgi:hypothetical protein